MVSALKLETRHQSQRSYKVLINQMVAVSDLQLPLSDGDCGLSLVLSHSRAGRCFSPYVTGGLCLEGGAGPRQQGDAAVLGGTKEEQYDLNTSQLLQSNVVFQPLKNLKY